jgi:hypothetical protein
MSIVAEQGKKQVISVADLESRGTFVQHCRRQPKQLLYFYTIIFAVMLYLLIFHTNFFINKMQQPRWTNE